MQSRTRTWSGAHRLVTWLLPPHRKEWADAMFNETAYIESRREAVQWILGCTFIALRERLVYQWGIGIMRRRALQVLLGASAVLVLGAVGIYAVSKPYQRDRIWITLRHAMHSGESQDLADIP